MQASPNHIGKYELISRLGRGGMGEVYKGFHPQLQRFVAIKVLLTSSETDPEFIQRFQNEALAVARLRHPHIVQVFDFDIEDHKPYMVMEFVEGETLAQRIARYHQAGQIMPTEEAVRLLQQLCSAVDYAHKQGMLHRDIKPANVLITPQGEAILTDFGLAKISGVSGLTASGSVMGTPHYMSPEQGQGQPMDARSDVYSLSVILYELLAGKRPFDADTPVRVVMQHITEPPPPIEQINPAVSGALAQVALVGMSKNPDERFRTAAALGAAITGAFNMSAARLNTAAAPDPLATVTADTDNAPTRRADKPGGPAGQAARGNISPPPPAVAGGPPAGGQLVNLAAHAPGLEPPRRKPSNQVGRYAVIGIVLLLIIISGGILLIALGNKTPSQTGTTPAIGSVGAVTFSDNDPNDFSHPANTLQAAFSNLQQPAGGATDFAWLCPSSNTTCSLLGAVLVQKNGSATLNHTQSSNLLGVSNLANLEPASPSKSPRSRPNHRPHQPIPPKRSSIPGKSKAPSCCIFATNWRPSPAKANSSQATPPRWIPGWASMQPCSINWLSSCKPRMPWRLSRYWRRRCSI